ncbi:MAG: hypothetical protein AMQ74_01678 [Candidatus Methanofastidiosum methylothiophilum]|uniref:Uncharacterized protein n=1 Tax=Candidatus Methanofastidiosum methylothiophilum TaxID=1705564 RepID=A0A150IR11_9EURY|nr:MAG: hypothetical protein AMQ74_01678 [Candidatus Methanofastidiosum methylthiophilus]
MINSNVDTAPQTINSLAKETMFPQSPFVLRQVIAEPIIDVRRGLMTPDSKGNPLLTKQEQGRFDRDMPQIFRAAEDFLMSGFQDIRRMQAEEGFDPVAYTDSIITEITPLLSTEPDKRQVQIELATRSVNDLLHQVQLLPEQAFEKKEISDIQQESPSPVSILRPANALVTGGQAEGTNLSMFSLGSGPTRQGGDSSGGVFDKFIEFSSSKLGGKSLGILTAVVSAINVGTTAAGLGNWDFTTPEGKLRLGKLALDTSLAVIWNLSQATALAFAVEYLRKGNLGKIAGTLRNIKNENFGTFLNFGAAVGLGILASTLLKGDIQFTADALQRFGDVSKEWGIPLAITIEIGSQFFTAYGTPASHIFRGFVRGAGDTLGKIHLPKKKVDNPIEEPLQPVDLSGLRTELRSLVGQMNNPTLSNRLLAGIEDPSMTEEKLRARIAQAKQLGTLPSRPEARPVQSSSNLSQIIDISQITNPDEARALLEHLSMLGLTAGISADLPAFLRNKQSGNSPDLRLILSQIDTTRINRALERLRSELDGTPLEQVLPKDLNALPIQKGFAMLETLSTRLELKSLIEDDEEAAKALGIVPSIWSDLNISEDEILSAIEKIAQSQEE